MTKTPSAHKRPRTRHFSEVTVTNAQGEVLRVEPALTGAQVEQIKNPLVKPVTGLTADQKRRLGKK